VVGGLLLVGLPISTYLLLPIITKYTFAPPAPKPAPVLPFPGGGNLATRLTPRQLQQLQSLGYIQNTPQGARIRPVTTSAAANLAPEVVSLLQSLGYVQVDDDEDKKGDGETEGAGDEASEPAP
jgi:hypothetical protein